MACVVKYYLYYVQINIIEFFSCILFSKYLISLSFRWSLKKNFLSNNSSLYIIFALTFFNDSIHLAIFSSTFHLSGSISCIHVVINVYRSLVNQSPTILTFIFEFLCHHFRDVLWIYWCCRQKYWT